MAILVSSYALGRIAHLSSLVFKHWWKAHSSSNCTGTQPLFRTPDLNLNCRFVFNLSFVLQADSGRFFSYEFVPAILHETILLMKLFMFMEDVFMLLWLPNPYDGLVSLPNWERFIPIEFDGQRMLPLKRFFVVLSCYEITGVNWYTL